MYEIKIPQNRLHNRFPMMDDFNIWQAMNGEEWTGNISAHILINLGFKPIQQMATVRNVCGQRQLRDFCKGNLHLHWAYVAHSDMLRTNNSGYTSDYRELSHLLRAGNSYSHDRLVSTANGVYNKHGINIVLTL